MEMEIMMEVSLKDGRTGYVRHLSETLEKDLHDGYVQVRFPCFEASNISEIPPPATALRGFRLRHAPP